MMAAAICSHKRSIGSNFKQNVMATMCFLCILDSIAVPVFAVWLNLTNTVSEYSIRMNTGRDALSIQNSLKDTIFGIFALKYAFYAHLIL